MSSAHLEKYLAPSLTQWSLQCGPIHFFEKAHWKPPLVQPIHRNEWSAEAHVHWKEEQVGMLLLERLGGGAHREDPWIQEGGRHFSMWVSLSVLGRTNCTKIQWSFKRNLYREKNGESHLWYWLLKMLIAKPSCWSTEINTFWLHACYRSGTQKMCSQRQTVN